MGLRSKIYINLINFSKGGLDINYTHDLVAIYNGTLDFMAADIVQNNIYIYTYIKTKICNIKNFYY